MKKLCVLFCTACAVLVYKPAFGQETNCLVPLQLTDEETSAIAEVLSETTAGQAGFEPGPFSGFAAPLGGSVVADGVISLNEYPNSCSLSFADRTNPAKPFPPLDTIEEVDGSEENDLSLVLHLGHTDEFLFLGFEVTDEFLDLQEGVSAFTNDSVELFINADVAINDFNPDTVGRNSDLEGFQIVADAAGDGDLALNNRFASGARPAPVGIEDGVARIPEAGEFFSAGLPSDSGWVLEFQLPLGSLDTGDDQNETVVAATTGDVMLMNFSVNDNDVEGAGGQDTHAMLWVVEGDERSNFGGGENVFVVPLALTQPTDITPGDFNNDGAVDAADFAILAGHFNMSGLKFENGDMNFNGRVDLSDFITFRAVYEATRSGVVAAVPEPSSSAFLYAAGILLLRLRQRSR